jgi:hypothetical protein
MSRPKIVILIKKNPTMSREEFIDYYERSHVVLAKRLLGHLMTSYVRNYPHTQIAYYPEEHDIADDYDAVTTMVLKDEASLTEFDRICKIPENAAAIMADEEIFQVRTETRVMMADEYDTGVELRPEDTMHEHLSHPPHSGVPT